MVPGFLTACLPDLTIEDLVPWAASQGFVTLEVAAWRAYERAHAPSHIDAERLSEDEAKRINDLFAEHNLGISSLAFYENPLHPDPERRRAHREHLLHVIDAAALLGVECVGTFVGADGGRPVDTIHEAGAYFRDVVGYAAERGVKVMVENCPMMNWVEYGQPGNLAYSPELWAALFDEVPSPHFGLNFDPSHLVWLGIDPYLAARDFAGRIFHAHAKDAEVLAEGQYRYGVLGMRLTDDPWDAGWWRYRMPGSGAIDWRAFIATLREVGYTGALSIEHEDPEFEGSEARVKEGLVRGLAHLRECGVNEGD